MRRGRTLIFLLVILIIGAILVFVVLQSNLLGGGRTGGAAPTPSSSVQVYYAAQSIPLGERITEDRLGLRTIPREHLTQDMFSADEKETLLSKVAKYPLDQGAFITESMVASEEGFVDPPPPEWAMRIPIGKTAVAIPITRLASVAYGVQDGAHVNVIACMLMVDIDPSFQTLLPNHIGVIMTPINAETSKMPGISLGIATAPDHPPTQGRTEVEPAFQQAIYVIPSELQQRPRLVCQMILQDVKVLKLGTFEVPTKAVQPTDPNAPTPASQTSLTKDKLPPDIITLVVDPQDAITLTYMIYANIPLNLTLRRGGDEGRQATEAATLQFLLSQYSIPVPVKLAYGITPRLDVLALPFLPNDVVTVSPDKNQ
jgi:pilus assembly protein CpaB